MSYESPAEHPTISDEERRYIEESIGESAQLMGAMEVSWQSVPLLISRPPCAVHKVSSLIVWTEIQDPLEEVLLLHARLCNHRGQLLQELDLLSAPHQPACIL